MNGKHTFSYVPGPDDPFDLTSVSVETKGTTLTEIAQAFEAYLLACGFTLPEGCHVGLEEDEAASREKAE